MYITICEADDQDLLASSMREAGQSKPVLWDNPEGWGGEGGGRGFRMGGTHAPLGDSC